MTDDIDTGLWRMLRPLLFSLDPEVAHYLTLSLTGRWARTLDRFAPTWSDSARSPSARRLIGIDFPNPIGLAAGLDKDAVAVTAWQRLGFGFVEVGTVTAHPQPGNRRPRLFRFPREGALVNRMGFNNLGAERMAQHLRAVRLSGRLRVPLGINIGKSKHTPPENAAEDYQRSFALLYEFADYVVVNVSSPNTIGLRNLQSTEDIKRIIGALQEMNQSLRAPRPLLVKLAPDLADADAIDASRAAVAEGCAGLILTNTTTDFSALHKPPPELSGGLSGRPLFARSTALLGTVRAALGKQPLLIGVGGIFSPEDAASKFAAGADLVQIYSGLIYGGPALVRRLVSSTASVSA